MFWEKQSAVLCRVTSALLHLCNHSYQKEPTRKHYYSYFVICIAHWSRPPTQTIEKWSCCVFLNFLGKSAGDLKTQLADTALLWGDQKGSEAAGQKMMNFKKWIVPGSIQNS